ncbi:MAG: hypothetical protein WDW38_002493 [Sanguina aurantia]
MADAEEIEKPEDVAAAEMRKKVFAIIRHPTMTDDEKAKAQQALRTGKTAAQKGTAGASGYSAAPLNSASLQLDEHLNCAMCLSLCERPVTAPCQHNFCLACFNKWHQQGKKTCPSCRAPFPAKFASNPRINTALTSAIRMAKNPVSLSSTVAKEHRRVEQEARPDEAFVTERAVKTGRANASSGRIRVTIPNDHFGPIKAEHDPENNGIKVGMFWKDRLDCRQWGAHFPHVAGIAGQSGVGAQSVVLSGGYEDDKDEGEWFLYTGSGGRDLSGNKRTSKVQSFDQVFENMNKALKESCLKGYPVRVVRSYKEKRSAYAPAEVQPVRYDGCYRILKCWRVAGGQGKLMCRYLFVRADNEPAPWSASEEGDALRMEVPKEAKAEIKKASGTVFNMGDTPFWDYDAGSREWGWAKPAPPSAQSGGGGAGRAPADPSKRLKMQVNAQEKLLKEFHCGLCRKVLTDPLLTPCGHKYCKGCIDGRFSGVSDVVAPCAGRPAMRERRNLKPCPECKADLCEFLGSAQVNRDMSDVIGKLQAAVAAAKAEAQRTALERAEGGGGGSASQGAASQGENDDGEGGEGQEEEEEEGDEAEEENKESKASVTAAATSKARPSSSDAPVAAAAAGTSSQAAAPAAGSSAAQPSQPASAAVAAAAVAAVAVAAGPSKPTHQYSSELALLQKEYPEFDESLVLGLLEDQGGDLLDVRHSLKQMSKQAVAASKPAKAPRAPKAAAKGVPTPAATAAATPAATTSLPTTDSSPPCAPAAASAAVSAPPAAAAAAALAPVPSSNKRGRVRPATKAPASRAAPKEQGDAEMGEAAIPGSREAAVAAAEEAVAGADVEAVVCIAGSSGGDVKGEEEGPGRKKARAAAPARGRKAAA